MTTFEAQVRRLHAKGQFFTAGKPVYIGRSPGRLDLMGGNVDYTGGLDDLRHRRIVSIGDPFVRFTEDPVRMLRAAVFAARLDFEMDEQVLEAIEVQGALIQKASPARLIEEYYKILRSATPRRRSACSKKSASSA